MHTELWNKISAISLALWMFIAFYHTIVNHSILGLLNVIMIIIIFVLHITKSNKKDRKITSPHQWPNPPPTTPKPDIKPPPQGIRTDVAESLELSLKENEKLWSELSKY